MKEAVYCGTRAIYSDMEMSAKSLYANSDVDLIHFFCEDDSWPTPLPEFVNVHNCSGQRYFRDDGVNMRSQFTYMAMMRAALCYELPESTRKILSLDADLLVERCCSNLWNLPIDDCYLSATPEPQYCVKGLRYVNVGVVLYNLEKLRDGKADEVIHLLNTQKLPNLEQDAFSYLCQGHIHEMDAAYNSNSWTNGYKDPVIIRHFAGIKREEWTRGMYAQYWRSIQWQTTVDLHNSLILATS